MSRRAVVPPELLARPFTVKQAAEAGVTVAMLRGRQWSPVVRGEYRHRSLALDDAVRLAAARLVLPPAAVATGLLAAWAHGAWRPAAGRLLPMTWAVERRDSRTRRPVDGSHRLVVGARDVVEAGGLVCTSPHRTAFQLMRSAGLVESVVVADAFAAAGLVQLPELYAYVDSHRRWPGVEVARRRLEHASRYARSPGETRLRMVFVLGGLPEPFVNVPRYRGDQLVAVPDLYLVARRAAAAEYDGRYHEDPRQRHLDHRRENRVVLDGLPVLRYDRYTVARHVERQRALEEMARAIGHPPPGTLRRVWFDDPRHPFRW